MAKCREKKFAVGGIGTTAALTAAGTGRCEVGAFPERASNLSGVLCAGMKLTPGNELLLLFDEGGAA